MANSLLLPAIVGLAVGTSMIVIFSVLYPSLQVWRGYDVHYCGGQPIGIIMTRANYPILAPTLLPNGYSLQFSELQKGNSVLFYNSEYFDRSVCKLALYRAAGSVSIVGWPLDYALDRSHYNETRQLVANYEKAAEHEPNGTSRNLPDGRSVVGYGQEKTIVWIFDDNTRTMYQLNAYMSLEDLIRIAESLKPMDDIKDVTYFEPTREMVDYPGANP